MVGQRTVLVELLVACAVNLIAHPVFAQNTANMPAGHSLAGGVLGMDVAVNSLNALFRDAYTNAKRETRQKLGPVIIVLGDKLIFRQGWSRQEFSYVPARWTTLKVADHVPLAVYLALYNHTDEPLDATTLERLAGLRKAAILALPEFECGHEVSGRGLQPQVLARQKAIFVDSIAFVDSTIKAGRVSAAELQGFSRRMIEPMMHNTDDAEVMELTSLNQHVEEIRKSLSQEEWKLLKVVIVTSHMARQQERTTQYFFQLFGEEKEGSRVVVFEGHGTEEQALDLLLTHEVDRSIGEAFFDDPERMHRDILSDSAAKFLKELKIRR